jgi:hypothetical protein
MVLMASSLARRRFTENPLTTACAGSGVGFVCFDDADELIEETFAFDWTKNRQDAALVGPDDGTQTLAQFTAFWSEAHQLRAPVSSIRLAPNQATLFQLANEDAGAVAVDSEAASKTDLIDDRIIVEVCQHGILQRGQILVGQGLGGHRRADLCEPTRQRQRSAMDGGAARPRDDSWARDFITSRIIHPTYSHITDH